MGDKTLAQTITICRYLGREFNLVGKDTWEAAKCDEYVDAINDLFNGMENLKNLKQIKIQILNRLIKLFRIF